VSIYVYIYIYIYIYIYMRSPVRKYVVSGGIDSTAEKSRVRRRFPPFSAREAVIADRAIPPRPSVRYRCRRRLRRRRSLDALVRSLSNYRGDDEKGWRARGEEGETCGVCASRKGETNKRAMPLSFSLHLAPRQCSRADSRYA